MVDDIVDGRAQATITQVSAAITTITPAMRCQLVGGIVRLQEGWPMTTVEVDKLSLRCDIGRREPARFAIEDALRTEPRTTGGWCCCEKLRVAPAGSSPRPVWRQAAMRDAWAAATDGARHGGEDGAGEANCM